MWIKYTQNLSYFFTIGHKRRDVSQVIDSIETDAILACFIWIISFATFPEVLYTFNIGLSEWFVVVHT